MGIAAKFGGFVFVPVDKDYPEGEAPAEILTGVVRRAIRDAGQMKEKVIAVTKRLHDNGNHFCTLLQIGKKLYGVPVQRFNAQRSLGQMPIDIFENAQRTQLTYKELVEFIKKQGNPPPNYRRFNLN